jgi:dipeptidyl-peptidase III
MMVKNRDQSLGVDELSQSEPAYFTEQHENEKYIKHIDRTVAFKVALHDVFSHGTGKLLSEISEDECNFDTASPPLNPLLFHGTNLVKVQVLFSGT